MTNFMDKARKAAADQSAEIKRNNKRFLPPTGLMFSLEKWKEEHELAKILDPLEID